MRTLTDRLKAARCHHRLFSKGGVMGSQVAVRKRMPKVALQLSNGAWGSNFFELWQLRLYNCHIMLYNIYIYYHYTHTHIYIYICIPYLGKFHHDFTVLPHWNHGLYMGNHPQMAHQFRLVKYLEPVRP